MWLQTYVKVSFNSSPHCCWNYFSDFQFRVDQLCSKLCSNDPLQLSLFASTLWSSASRRLLLVEILISIFSFVCLAETLSRSSVSQSYLRSKLWIDSFISFFLFIFSSTIDRFVKVQEALVIVFLVETRSIQKVIVSALSVCLCVFFLLISLSLSLCFFRSFLRWTVSWFGTSDASGLLNGLWIHISGWRNWIVGVYNWLHWARPAFALVTSREFPLHVSVLFRWAEHKNPHTGTVESLATSRAQLSAQMIDYRASRAFRRKADSAWDEEWERRGCCTLLFPKKRMSEWAGTVRIGTWTKRKKGADGRRVKSRRRVM